MPNGKNLKKTSVYFSFKKTMKLTGKTAVVTGASKGIGAAIAKALANEGANVVAHYHSDKSGAEAVVNELLTAGGNAVSIKANITIKSDVKSLFEQAGSIFGQIDILINNAGVFQFGPISMATEDEFHRQFNSNVLGSILSIQESLTYFPETGGSIINISSVASVKATPHSVIYSATKGALDAITRVLSKELAEKKIRVNSILPGPTKTEGNPVENPAMEQYIVSQIPFGRLGRPTDISGLAVFLASDDSSWITGQKIVVSGGMD